MFKLLLIWSRGRAYPAGPTLIYLCLLLLTTIMGFPMPGNAAPDVQDAMVKIYLVANRPDYDNPWNRQGPEAASGSGGIIAGERILTNAHVVSDHTFLQVQRHGQAKKYTARVAAVAHDADLALLSVDDPGFFTGITPLPLGPLPEVQTAVTVYGFPEGGDTLSMTAGVLSRVEQTAYVHSTRWLLGAQLDAAINSGNSGGPVLVEGQIVGVAMQNLTGTDNIAYMVPSPIIAHVLSDIEDGTYDGFPALGIETQTLENASLKRMATGSAAVTGVRVTHVVPGAPAEGHLLPGDVLLSVDGHAIADDGTVIFLRHSRTSFDYYVQQHQVGELLTVEFLRAGQTTTRQVRLGMAPEQYELVPGYRYDVRPSYYIFGGLVFCPLTLDYLRTWGTTWYLSAPAHLLNAYTHGRARQPDEEVVVITKVLPAETNAGYEDFVNRRIVAVNQQPINNLRELVALVEQPADGAFVVLTTARNEQLVFDRLQAARDHPQILATYEVARDRSGDVQPNRVEVFSQLP